MPANIATHGMTGAAAGASGVAGFVTHANRAMETTQASAALSALHEELGPAPLSGRKGVVAIADSPSPTAPVHSCDLSSLIDVCPLQLRSHPVPVSQQVQAIPVHSFDLSPSMYVGSLQLRSPSVPVTQFVGHLQPSPRRPVSPSLAHTTSTPPAACPLKPVSQLTPIVLDRLQYELRNYPNPDKAAYVIQGLRHGFHLGFNHNISLKSTSGNMASALKNPQVIDNYLHTEVQLGRVAGPFLQPPFHGLHVSRFGVIPKRNQPGK